MLFLFALLVFGLISFDLISSQRGCVSFVSCEPAPCHCRLALAFKLHRSYRHSLLPNRVGKRQLRGQSRHNINSLHLWDDHPHVVEGYLPFIDPIHILTFPIWLIEPIIADPRSSLLHLNTLFGRSLNLRRVILLRLKFRVVKRKRREVSVQVLLEPAELLLLQKHFRLLDMDVSVVKSGRINLILIMVLHLEVFIAVHFHICLSYDKSYII